MIRTFPLALTVAVAVSGCSSTPTASPAAPGASAPASAPASPDAAGPGDTSSATPGLATAPAAPRVTATDQPVEEDTVAVGAAADVPAFVVLHRDLDGAPGEIVGHAPVAPGGDQLVVVPLEASAVSIGDVLWAMLHTDAGETGTYEFPGPDVPLRDASGAVVMTPFEITDED